MRLVDTNVLLYAVNDDAPHHEASRAWLDSALGGAEGIGFAWIVLLAFLRLSTRSALWSRPLTVDEAAGRIELWLRQPPAVVVQPTSRHLAVLHGLLGVTGTSTNLVADAHLAALALEHGAGVVSFDRDFARFEGLRWSQPGEEASS